MRLRDEIASLLFDYFGCATESVQGRAADAVVDLLRREGMRALSPPGHPGEWITDGGRSIGAIRWLLDLGDR